MSTNHIEIETVDRLRVAAPDLAGQVVQGVDLTGCSNPFIVAMFLRQSF